MLEHKRKSISVSDLYQYGFVFRLNKRLELILYPRSIYRSVFTEGSIFSSEVDLTGFAVSSIDIPLFTI